jgi:excisionase family DNA binding protein
MTEELIRPSVAAKRLGIARSTIYKWIGEGRIGSVELPGGMVRIPRADLEAFERQFKRRAAEGLDNSTGSGVKSPNDRRNPGRAATS